MGMKKSIRIGICLALLPCVADSGKVGVYAGPCRCTHPLYLRYEALYRFKGPNLVARTNFRTSWFS